MIWHADKLKESLRSGDGEGFACAHSEAGESIVGDFYGGMIADIFYPDLILWHEDDRSVRDCMRVDWG